MIYIGIDVAKYKHDCFVTNQDGEVLMSPFTISNTMNGFNELISRIHSITSNPAEIKIGLEATGHYTCNILGFLLNKGLTTYVINPLCTNLHRKSLSLRLTKTDPIDARVITSLLMSSPDLKPYSHSSYHNEELKSLTRYRFEKVNQRARLKATVRRLVVILFPELESLVATIHIPSVYALLAEFPSAQAIASAHLTRLTNLLQTVSYGRFDRNTAITFRDAAKNSIGSNIPAKSLELRHTLRLIAELSDEIKEVEAAIKTLVDEINSPIFTIPGINYDMGALILGEIGDFNRFDSPAKLLAFAGLSPTTYQSGTYESGHAHMEKRGSRYLRYALFNAAKNVCRWEPTFNSYLAKKRLEGKHYYVALSHAMKKLLRVMYHLEKEHCTYQPGQ